jgi:1-acyl-sn-glycerol-3-phosphate acyltransferase
MKVPLGHRIFLFFIKPLLGLILQIIGPWRTEGKQRVPRKGALLILSNHQSYMDPVFVQVICPRWVRFMARRPLFTMPRIGKFITWFGAFPVDQNSPDRGALKKAVELIREGNCVCVFPEGNTSEDGELLPLYAGPAVIIRQTECPIICLGLKNVRAWMPPPSEKLRAAKSLVSAKWGEVHQFKKGQTAEEIMEWVEAELRRLTA